MRWLRFWICVLVALLAFGSWQSLLQAQAERERGIDYPTRSGELLHKLPVAGINVDLTQYEDPVSELQQIADLGFVWIRQPFLWSAIEPAQGEFAWNAYDKLVDAVSQVEGLQLVALLDGSPAWARHADAPEHPFAPPASPTEYGNFARAVAERYGAQIDYYQIWDEPNIEEHWGNLNPRPALYVAMLEAAYTAIHAADSQAMVIAAALAPNTETGPDNINDPEYLREIYALGGGDYFDAAAGKPYGFNLPPTDRTIDLNTLNFSRLILLREIMVENGDSAKPLWGSNFGWNALPNDWTGASSIWGQVTFTQKYDYTKQAFERAQNEWAWLGGLILQHWEPNAPPDDPIQGFAIKPLADRWQDVIPSPDGLTHGIYPANTPFAIYDGDWDISEIGADAGADADLNTITVPFYGNEFALQVRRGDYLAYLGVTIDDQPANALPRRPDGEAFIALTSARRDEVIDLIVVAEGLSDGRHVAVISHRPELGDDRYPIVGFAVSSIPERNSLPIVTSQVVLALSALLAIFFGWRLPWGNIKPPSPHSIRNILDFSLGLLLSLIVVVGTALTLQDTLSAALRRDVPAVVAMLAGSSLLYYAPATWIALIGLLLTGIVIFGRPLLGVMLVMFWAAFFTSNIDPFFRVIAVVDALLVVTVVATVARLSYDYAKNGARLLDWDHLWRIKFHPLDLMVIGLVLLGALSLTWSEQLSEAIREWRVMLVEPALLYGVLRILKLSRRDLAFLVEGLLFTGFLIATIGIVQYVTDTNVVIAEEGARRLTSVYGSPNSAGLMLGRCLPFALAYVLLPISDWRRAYGVVTGATMFIALALTQSVGALLLGVPAAVVVVLIGWRGRRAVPLVAGVSALGIVGLAILSRVLPRLQQITDLDNNTFALRRSLWRSTAQLLQEHPVTGVGLDQFLYAYRSRYILPAAWEDPDLSHPHNVLLDYWVRLGIGGVLLGIGIQWYFWHTVQVAYQKWRGIDALRFGLVLGAMGAMANFLAHGLADMAHFNINLSFVLVFLLGLMVQLAQHVDESPPPTQ